MKFAANHWNQIGHFYAPIPAYGGNVLKYQGIVTEGNRAHLVEKHPNGVILDAYKGDRIRAADHSEFEPLGANSKAHQLARKTWDEIEAAAKRISNDGTRATFDDGSFIEWERFGHHQAFLSNGWNVTPR
jgi:predicted ATP-dependent Lon-type protease